jgi:DNA-directed RNA polymerase subunit alpha
MDQIPLPNSFEFTDVSPSRATLVVKPLFERYGTTIGNALRRILLSSMPGAAITHVKIQGVDHEFSAMEGVQEDVVDILLNLKQVRLKLHAENVRLSLNVKGKKVITAADIQENSDVEVINKDQHIATLTSDASEFIVEIVADRGRGYVATAEREEQEKEIGMIAVDSIYTPVKNVAMDIENVRVGQLTNFDQLTLDIETDGSITPKEAVALSSQILVDHFSLFLEQDMEVQTKRTDLPETQPEELGTEDEISE